MTGVEEPCFSITRMRMEGFGLPPGILMVKLSMRIPRGGNNNMPIEDSATKTRGRIRVERIGGVTDIEGNRAGRGQIGSPYPMNPTAFTARAVLPFAKIRVTDLRRTIPVYKAR